MSELRSAHAAHPLYGTRRLAIHLGWGRNKTRRVRNLAGVEVQRPSKRHRGHKATSPEILAPPNILHRYAKLKDKTRPQNGMDYHAMTQANAWAQDFTYLWWRGRWYYLAAVVNLTTREIVGWRLGTNHTSELTHAALLDALSRHPTPAILHSDQGSEYLSHKHQILCQRMEIRLSASNKGSPWQNTFMERTFGSLKAELGQLSEFGDLPELVEAIALTIHYFNNDRIHTALKMSPAAYAAVLKQTG